MLMQSLPDTLNDAMQNSATRGIVNVILYDEGHLLWCYQSMQLHGYHENDEYLTPCIIINRDGTAVPYSDSLFWGNGY